MKNYIPTIEELRGIEKSELNVMFRKATEIAADLNRDPMERAAAIRTIENFRRCLMRPPAP